MKKEYLISLVAIVIIACLSVVFIKSRPDQSVEPKKDVAKPTEPVVNKSDEFYISMLKLENKSKNIIYSPLSIRHALTLVKEGSAGQTKKEIDSVLGEYTLNKYSNIQDHLSLVNSLFIREKYKNIINQEYIENVSKKYGAEINYDEFKDAKNVNNWISEKTFEMLKDVLSDDSVQDEDLRLLLVNALAVDMEWEDVFDPSDTHSESFNTGDGKKIDVTMMMSDLTKEDSLSYYKDDKLVAFGKTLKKYGDYQFEFIGICPEDLNEYIKNLDKKQIDKVVSNLKKSSDVKDGVTLKVPKFEYEYNLPLVANLKKMGVVTMFDADKADLSGISSKEHLFISDGIHKAKIEFGEKGMKAAAVTVFYAKANSAREQPAPVEIVFDKPFMYIVREKNTNDIWFVGTVYRPNLWKNDKSKYEER